MARKDNRIITKADYTLSKRHMKVPGGAIYEHDHVTIQKLDDDEQTFSDSIFKFRIRPGGNPRKRHIRGKWAEWLDNEGNKGEKWTLNSVDTTISDETKIRIKPDYSSLRDFACYGSAVDLVKASVNDIALHFPGSIMLTNQIANKTSDDDGNEKIISIYDATADNEVSGNLYFVSNETLINVDSPSNITIPEGEDKLKYLQSSLSDYTDGNDDELKAETVSLAKYPWCDGTIVGHVQISGVDVMIYYKNGKKYLLSKSQGDTVLAKVKEDKVKEYFDSLDDFESVLLDRSSRPIYTAKFETPYSDSYGYHYRMETYTFPTMSDGFTPDLSSSAFSMYVERLAKLADFHDNYDTDNIWRMMTHEAIKNLDWTFVRDKDGEPDDMSDIDSTRMEMILKLYGRQYDDILRMIDGIKSTNRVTYDEKNNVPDYFLSDLNDIGGWELTNVSPTTDNSLYVKVKVKEIEGDGDKNKGNKTFADKYYFEYNGVDANTAFLRNLKLNSSYINSMKGTRQGIETLLGLFGMRSKTMAPDNYDYELKEFIVKAGECNTTYDDIVSYNERKDENGGDGIDIDLLSGLPLAYTSDGNVIPWYDSKQTYDGGIWFQMKGGWGQTSRKDIELSIAPDVKELTEDDSLKLYGETLGYLKFADSLSNMLEFKYSDVKKGDICYATNISGLDSYNFGNKDILAKDLVNASHYFILVSREHSTTLGYDEESGCYGWRAIAKSEYDGSGTFTPDGKKVLYLESLKASEKGNNPHCGYGEYDNGKEYLDRFRRIFGYAIDNNWFSSLDNDTIEKINNVGFDISEPVEDKDEDGKDKGKIEYFNEQGFYTCEECKRNGQGFYTCNDYEPKQKVIDEREANYIINVKNFEINFKDIGGDEEFKKARRDYILNVVLPFVEQMIPSTAIFRYTIGNETQTQTAKKSRKKLGKVVTVQPKEAKPMETVAKSIAEPMTIIGENNNLASLL